VHEAAPVEPEVTVAGPLKEMATELDASIEGDFAPETITVDAVIQPSEAPSAHPHAQLAPAAETAPVVSGQATSALGEFVSDLEASLGDDFLKGAPVPEATTPAVQIPAAAPVAAPNVMRAAAAAGPIASPVVPPQVPAATASPKPMTPPAAAKLSPFGDEPGVDLAEMFGELKHDLESESSPAEEDPETHYNLGIAFREMGLLDEAIGELQKTCQAFDRGRPFPQIMQTYTWLAQCFLDKGVAEAAVRWYQKALAVHGIDQETRTALHYELASAYELLGDKPAALKHFMEVYSSNIDYRDVAERIKALKS